MSDVFLVEGRCGDYEFRSWIVAAFTDRSGAARFAELAKAQSEDLHRELTALRQEWFDENDGKGGPAYEAWCARTAPGTHTAVDPKHDFSAGEETTYTVVPVPLDPPAQERLVELAERAAPAGNGGEGDEAVDVHAVALEALRARWVGEASAEDVVRWIFWALDEAGDQRVPRDEDARARAVSMANMVFVDLEHEGIDRGAVVSNVLRACERRARSVERTPPALVELREEVEDQRDAPRTVAGVLLGLDRLASAPAPVALPAPCGNCGRPRWECACWFEAVQRAREELSSLRAAAVVGEDSQAVTIAGFALDTLNRLLEGKYGPAPAPVEDGEAAREDSGEPMVPKADFDGYREVARETVAKLQAELDEARAALAEPEACAACRAGEGGECHTPGCRYWMDDAPSQDTKREAGEAMADVLAERERQNEKWGVQNHDPLGWVAILTEETGEVAKEVADSLGRPLDGAAYRKELVQVAAVAVQAIQCFDRLTDPAPSSVETPEGS